MRDVADRQVTRRHPLPEAKYRFVCVFPAELGTQIKALAVRERRTITAQVQLLVEEALSQKPEPIERVA